MKKTQKQDNHQASAKKNSGKKFSSSTKPQSGKGKATQIKSNKSKATKFRSDKAKSSKTNSAKTNLTTSKEDVSFLPRAHRISSSQLEAEPNEHEIATVNQSDKNELVVVGIGASAGGLEALQVLIPTLPISQHITYIVAQHLDPKHPSMLVSLLRRHTDMPVEELKPGTIPKPATVYITPPDRNVVYENGHLNLNKPVAGSLGPKPSIDIFFSSLGEQLLESAVGIILSGTGSDGSHGVKAIKANGGFIIVQDPESAKYDGMPRSAIDTGCVDLVLPSPEIGRELPGILVYPTRLPLLTQEEGALKALQSLYAQLHQSTGCDFSEYKQNTIHRRIGRRMAVHKMTNLSDYLELAETSPAELEALYKDIIISVTSFFRDTSAYGILQDVIGQIIDLKEDGDSLRIWVAGCASGEEAYSIAMLVSESLAQKKRKLKTYIFATDIDTDALARARKGLYPEAAIHEVDKAIVKKFFTRSENYYRVIKPIREMVVFSRQDLVKDPPFSHLDLVSCRNVLIYFSPHLQQRLIPMFHYVLNPNGFLFLGKSESTGQFIDLFSPVEKKAKIFKRRGGGRTRRIQVGSTSNPNFPVLSRTKLPPTKEVPLVDIVNRLVAETYGHPSVVVDAHLEVLHVRGDVSPYLSLAQGDAGLNVLAMARPDLRTDLRASLIKCTRDQSTVVTKSLVIKENDQEHVLKLHLRPIKDFKRASGTILIMFEPVTKAQPVKVTARSIKGLTNERISELESELNATQEHLQTTVQELETTNEELQALNEELQSANEELQSSNEELETSNEELQSTNEELTTLNEELQERSAELATTNTDLENIQEAVGSPMLVVDRACRLTRFTPTANRIFQVSEEHLGHGLTTIPSHFDIPSIREDVTDVINNEKAKTREVQHEGLTYLFQILPYQTADQQTVGALLLFTDKTADRAAEQCLRESEMRFREMTDHIRDVFWMANPTGEIIVYVSPAYEKIWGHPCQSLYDRGLAWMDSIHPEDRTATREAFFEKARKGEFSHDFRIIRPNGDVRWIWNQAFTVLDENGEVSRLVGIAKDISDRKLAERTIQEKEQRFRTVFDSAFQLMVLFDPEGTVLEANERMLDFCGMRHEEIIGKCLWDGPITDVSEHTGPFLQHAIESVAAGKGFARYSGQFIGGKKKPTCLDVSIRVVKGKPVNSLVMEANVTNTK